MELPPHKLITTSSGWRQCLQDLRKEPRLALDLEANSMFAYQPRVCLIQISTPRQDYIVDPLAPLDLSGLGELIADPKVEKIFHAAEYDLILLKGEYGWQLHNLFDTMWAARILGYERYGLANMLQQLYGVKLNKRYQKSNWCKRPLSAAQLTYAQYDTRFLLQLREDLGAQLESSDRLMEASETFAEQTRVEAHNHEFDPDSFWSISGVHDLTRRQQAILKALTIFRDDEARRRNQPHFKIFGDRTLLELAHKAPRSRSELQTVYGMTEGQVRRYGSALFSVIQEAHRARLPSPRKRNNRLPDAVIHRYEKLHNWRKRRAQERGVESDVIVSRDALWAVAKQNPRTTAELAEIDLLGTWRQQTYGPEIIRLLHNS